MMGNRMHSLTQLLLFFYSYCGIALPHCFLSAQISNEASVLLSIKSGLVDPLGRLGDWTLSSAHCNWTGVHCNSFGAVDSLNLNHKNLSGLIKDDIKHLPSLAHLNISSNAFTSSLPNALSSLSSLKLIDISQNLFVGGFPGVLGKLAGLTTLNASSNSFTGPLPDDLENVSSLETLDLRGNFFEGSIPTSFKNLQKLKFLGLSGNNLTGRFPREIGMLSSLETMIMGYNEFDGEIPAEFGYLTSIRYIDLAVGNLGGAIPDELGRLKQLDTLFLYNNNFEGKIPPSIGNITSLKLLDLSDNLLSGEIPVQIGDLKNLQLLNLMCNNLSGSVPPALGELTQLQVLELWNNSFSGALPDNLGHNSPLQWLDASSNAFSGSIPASLCNGGNLTKLILFNNALTGPIPTNLTSCFSLVRVRIQNNFLSGTIPVGLGKLGKLQRLELANNILSGKIPDDISLSTSLSFIDLSRNRLQFSLPSSVLSIPNLQTFIVSNNNLQGKIPDQFQDCPSLAVLDLSSNHFSGTIPTSVASCQKLVTLNLRNNQLTGEIPRPIANMPTLAVLDLSNNSLTGGIPENFGSSPALEMLNVSYNKLEGPVPTNGMLKTINPDDLVGNSGLCGGVLPPCNQNPSYVSHQQHVKHIIVGWLIGILTLLAIGLAMFGALSLYKKWSSGESWFKKKFETGNGEWPWRLVAFQRIGFASADILACIKDSNIIGSGATGIVYKAEMQGTKAIVAVKKLHSSATDIEAGTNREDIVGEVNLLGKLRHRNIVRLLGFLHNDTNAMILYEYMPNGSLGEALHGKGRLLVDWVSRYNIALGVAQGLAYLHHDCQPPVIHRDIKSNNILLDGNLEARIADFGLARMMLRRNQTVTMVAGSYGYIAPEYGYTLKVDEKSDIYSYGVVLLELLTGKRPLEQEFGDSVDIVEWVRRRARTNAALQTHLDPNLGNSKHVQEEMLLVLRIALLCTAKMPKDRPSMRDVITVLGEAKPRRKSSSNSHGDESSKDKPIFSTSPVNGLI